MTLKDIMFAIPLPGGIGSSDLMYEIHARLIQLIEKHCARKHEHKA